MSKVLVLGLGNDLLTDDAIGLLVAHEVRQRVAGDPRIEVRETAEMGLALLDLITNHEALILVDSIETGEHPPGHVYELEHSQLPAHPAHSPHAVGIETVRRLGHIRGLAMPNRISIIAIEVLDPHTLGTEMTPEVASAVDEAADLVVQRALDFADSPPAASAP